VVIEADHWWYGGRRLLFSDLIKAFGLPGNADNFDFGALDREKPEMGIAVGGILEMSA